VAAAGQVLLPPRRHDLGVPSPYPRLNDPDWLRTEYIDRGRTARDIAAEVGCPDKAVDRALRRHGIRRPPHRTLADVPTGWLREQYVHRRRSIIDIAAEVGLSRTSIRRALEEADVPVDTGRLPAELDDADWLAAQDGVAGTEFARRLGVTPDAVSRARQRHGLLAVAVPSPKYPQLGDRAWLEDRYGKRGMTQAQIAAEVRCSRSAVALAMDRLGIDARPTKVAEYPELHDDAWLAERLAEGLSPAAIADRLGCHRTSVADALRKHRLR
jgi:AraC-like DNA-binding protein